MSTILHKQGFNSAWIETQLAHVDKNSIRGTYNHAQYLDGRREMMQWYADYIDDLALGNIIIKGTFGQSAYLYCWAGFLDAKREKSISPFDYAKINNQLK